VSACKKIQGVLCTPAEMGRRMYGGIYLIVFQHIPVSMFFMSYIQQTTGAFIVEGFESLD
jgi:hypothetical protein